MIIDDQPPGWLLHHLGTVRTASGEIIIGVPVIATIGRLASHAEFQAMASTCRHDTVRKDVLQPAEHALLPSLLPPPCGFCR